MSKTLTLTFEGNNELLLKAIDAYSQSEMFSDEEGNSVRLSREEIALNMLMEGCIEWVHDIAGIPEELELEILEAFEVEEDDSEEAEGCGECSEEGHDHNHENGK